MKEELIGDLWHVIIEHIPEKARKDVAADFVNTLIDHGVKDVVLSGLMGVDSYLDQAIEYATNGDDYSEQDDYTGYEDEEE